MRNLGSETNLVVVTLMSNCHQRKTGFLALFEVGLSNFLFNAENVCCVICLTTLNSLFASGVHEIKDVSLTCGEKDSLCKSTNESSIFPLQKTVHIVTGNMNV